MYELVYCSQGVSDLKNDNILDILKVAREFNADKNITGCLLYYNNQFVQILEGEEDVIQELYATIEKDKRHEDVLLLSQGNKEARYFPNWSMAFRELKESDFEKINDKIVMDNFIAFADLVEKDTQSMHVFWSMAKQIMEDKTA